MPLRDAASVLDSPAFRRWFAGSKVVDSQGNPLVVYHGSPYPGIRVFDPGSKTTALLGRGIYFTRERDEALEYAKGDAGRVYAVFLRVKRPFIRYQSSFGPAGLAIARKHIGRSAGPGDDYYVDEKLKMLSRGSFLPDNISADMLTSMFLADGHDGVFEGRHICVFDPRQIKSATDNVGAFDPDDPSFLAGVRRPRRR